MSSIELSNVGKSWGEAVALHRIDLAIEAGTFCVLLGPSGCGKSTTLRIIAGLEGASSGQVRIDGRDVTALPPAQRGIAMVFQNYALFPHLSVADNITFGLSVRKTPAAETARRLQETAGLLGLDTLLDRRPGQLSGGQQQRVALGRALVAQAKVCLMDEPLSNLDAQLRQEMRLELRELQRKLGLTVVYVTHDQTEAMSMADQVVLLNRGRVEQAGAPRDALRAAGHDVRRALHRHAADESGGAGWRLHCGERRRGRHARGHAGRAAGIDRACNRRRRHPGRGAQCRISGGRLVLRCAVGSETLLVRAAGQHIAQPGDAVGLRWQPHDAHGFDAAGVRIS